MTAKPITENQQRQLKQFLENFVASAVHSALQQVAGTLDKESAQEIIEHGGELKADLEKATVDLLRQLSKEPLVFEGTKLLCPVNSVAVPIRAYTIRELIESADDEIYVTGEVDEFLVGEGARRSYSAAELKKDSCDWEIRRELPRNHFSSIADMTSLIKAQSRGEQGFLLTNGRENLFYVAGENGTLSVSAAWEVLCDQWFVEVFNISEGCGVSGLEREVGIQVIYPGTASL